MNLENIRPSSVDADSFAPEQTIGIDVLYERDVEPQLLDSGKGG